jgi:hypothetical protein
MISYLSLPSAQRRPQQIADKFNAAQVLWRSLEQKRRYRRRLCPNISPELHKQLDLLDFAAAQRPKIVSAALFKLTKFLL